MNNSPLLPLVYDHKIVEHLIEGGWTGVINSPLLLSAYHNKIVEHLIGGGGLGRLIVLSCSLHIITR